MRNPAETQDEYEDEQGRIWPKVTLTPYDKQRMKLRELEAKRDAILGKAETTDDDRMRLAKLTPLIVRATERFEREAARAKDDVYRKRRSIDAWRAGDGRDEYNTKRRKRRDHPNADLSEMTPEEKAEYKRIQRKDANWFKRQRKNGLSEAAITAAYALRLEARKNDQHENSQEEADMAAIRARAIM